MMTTTDDKPKSEHVMPNTPLARSAVKPVATLADLDAMPDDEPGVVVAGDVEPDDGRHDADWHGLRY